MRTQDLINAIAQDAGASLPSPATRVVLALLIGGTMALSLFVYGLGLRPDIGLALQTWRFDAKLGITLLCCAAALRAMLRLLRPDGDQRWALAGLYAPLLVLTLALVSELISAPAQTWAARAIGTNSRLCLASITLLSIAPLAALLIGLRTGAPRSPAITGATAGLLAGGLAATLYALHCPDDSPLFVALWYTLAVALTSLAGSAFGHRLLRW